MCKNYQHEGSICNHLWPLGVPGHLCLVLWEMSFTPRFSTKPIMVYILPSQKGVAVIYWDMHASACIVASVCMARARQTEDKKTGSWDRETAWAKRAEVLCQGLKCGGVLGGDLNWSDFTCWPESTDKRWDFPFSKHISVACSSEALLDLHRLVNSCRCPIFWIPNIPFQFFEILLPDFDVSTGQEQFYKQKWESIRAAQAWRLGKKTPTTQRAFYLHLLIIWSLSSYGCVWK